MGDMSVRLFYFEKTLPPAPMKPFNLVKVKALVSTSKNCQAEATVPAMRHFTNDYPIIDTQALRRAPKEDRF
jgi:hypothetical protein